MSSKRGISVVSTSPRKKKIHDSDGEIVVREGYKTAPTSPNGYRMIRVSSEEVIHPRSPIEDDSQSISSRDHVREKKRKKQLVEEIIDLEEQLDESNRMRTLLKSRLEEMKQENLRLRATMMQALGTDPSPNDIKSIQGTTLSLAVSLRRLDWIQQMVDHGAHLGDLDYTGSSAIHIAATTNQVDILRFLLDHKFPHDVRDASNRTAFECSLTSNSYDAAEVLEIEDQRQSCLSLVDCYNSGGYIHLQAPKLPRANSEIRSRTGSVPKLHLDGLGPKSLSNPQIYIIQADKDSSNQARRMSDATKKPLLELQSPTYLSDCFHARR